MIISDREHRSRLGGTVSICAARTLGRRPWSGWIEALMKRTARMGYLVLSTVVFIAILSNGAARACTATTMLDLIASLEAPDGYDQVYSGVTVSPPRAITEMTVAEVLDWQRDASRTSVSSAAGRYQVIRPTLREMLAQGVVRENEVFGRHAQDKIALHLLNKAGYRSGQYSPAVANRIAGIWAALPQIGGSAEGLSVYEGYAGNHALIDAKSYRAVMQCEMDVDAAERLAGQVRRGLGRAAHFNALIEAMRDLSQRLDDIIPKAALSLLLTLFTVDLVVRFGRAGLDGDPLSALIRDLAFKTLSVGLFMFLILGIGDVIDMVAEAALRIGSDATGSDGFSLSGYARSKTILMFSFSEGIASLGWVFQATINAIGLVVMILTAVVMGLVTWAWAKLFIVAAAGVVVVGMGGLTVLHSDAKRYFFFVVGAGLQITAIILIVHLGQVFAQDLRGGTSGLQSALLTLLIDVTVIYLCITVPAAMANLAKAA